jgi:hypothetical protein
MTITRCLAATLLAAALAGPVRAGQRPGMNHDTCIGFLCHDFEFGNEGEITYERLYNKKLTRKQAYKVCKSKYVLSDVMLFRLSNGDWECRIRRP